MAVKELRDIQLIKMPINDADRKRGKTAKTLISQKLPFAWFCYGEQTKIHIPTKRFLWLKQMRFIVTSHNPCWQYKMLDPVFSKICPVEILPNFKQRQVRRLSPVCDIKIYPENETGSIRVPLTETILKKKKIRMQ